MLPLRVSHIRPSAGVLRLIFKQASQLVRGRGRPPKDPTKGMRQNCTFRLPENTRNKLLLAAVASNRTLSEEIEWRVEQWVALQEREAALKEREAALRELEAKLKAREERLARLEPAADRVA